MKADHSTRLRDAQTKISRAAGSLKNVDEWFEMEHNGSPGVDSVFLDI